MGYYNRVIPRDLFNEAKLLKCLGRVALKVYDKIGISKFLDDCIEDAKNGFDICQNEDGSLYCSNYYLFDNNGTPIYLSSPLNSRLNYPMVFEYQGETDFLFDDDGEFSEAFIKLFVKFI